MKFGFVALLAASLLPSACGIRPERLVRDESLIDALRYTVEALSTHGGVGHWLHLVGPTLNSGSVTWAIRRTAVQLGTLCDARTVARLWRVRPDPDAQTLARGPLALHGSSRTHLARRSPLPPLRFSVHPDRHASAPLPDTDTGTGTNTDTGTNAGAGTAVSTKKRSRRSSRGSGDSNGPTPGAHFALEVARSSRALDDWTRAHEPQARLHVVGHVRYFAPRQSGLPIVFYDLAPAVGGEGTQEGKRGVEQTKKGNGVGMAGRVKAGKGMLPLSSLIPPIEGGAQHASLQLQTQHRSAEPKMGVAPPPDQPGTVSQRGRKRPLRQQDARQDAARQSQQHDRDVATGAPQQSTRATHGEAGTSGWERAQSQSEQMQIGSPHGSSSSGLSLGILEDMDMHAEKID